MVAAIVADVIKWGARRLAWTRVAAAKESKGR
jgi:hypothetical protein